MYFHGEWLGKGTIIGQKYVCGYCGTETSSSGGYNFQQRNEKFGFYEQVAFILICTSCNFPTFLTEDYTLQVPQPKMVANVENLPPPLAILLNETRKAISAELYNSTVLLCRKMLMNLAVLEGADKNKSFVYYVDYLERHDFITAKMKPWVDRIRQIGNTATHEIPDISKEDAYMSFEFLIMLLKLVYEFPHKMQPK
ncbi:DUF4145 domain-containing protein [Neobacillus sp. YIM B06451]|uniref:DUF4145 domain-containing protein n=1 Tax=Neobacillus sp. YIM B06451 TaxID=3070994 RepID=UPI00292EC435|nr:DUF4145 domain-containing protein [Neobacillus sp. YIM B06451]